MHDHRTLFEEQSISWPLAAKNYKAQSDIIYKEFQIDGFRIRLQFNPGRIISSSANTSKVAIEVRPCFLCAKNRPVEQHFLTFKEDDYQTSDTGFQILVNPFPVFPEHYTIAATEHEPQTIKGHFETSLRLAKAMNDCVVFYNGPRCGASAPDHLHFQAGSKGQMPVEADYNIWRKTNLSLLWKGKDSEVFKIKGLLRNGWLMEGKTPTALIADFEQLLSVLESANETSDEEPMLNLLCWYENDRWICLIFPRKAHRPKCYFREDDTRLLISPASVEMGGLMIAARREDFERIEVADIREIFHDVSVSKEEIDLLSEKFIEKITAHL